jgi:hypothetical protein
MPGITTFSIATLGITPFGIETLSITVKVTLSATL